MSILSEVKDWLEPIKKNIPDTSYEMAAIDKTLWLVEYQDSQISSFREKLEQALSMIEELNKHSECHLDHVFEFIEKCKKTEAV